MLGVLGDDPFDRALDEAVHGEKVNSRPLVVRRFKRGEDVGDCQILFISRSETSALERIFASLKGRSTATSTVTSRADAPAWPWALPSSNSNSSRVGFFICASSPRCFQYFSRCTVHCAFLSAGQTFGEDINLAVFGDTLDAVVCTLRPTGVR